MTHAAAAGAVSDGPPEPQVTVVIPTRDRWPMLSRTLGTALAQDVSFEVVIVDDGSEDETPERLAALGDPRVRILRHDRSQGVARSRNDGNRGGPSTVGRLPR